MGNLRTLTKNVKIAQNSFFLFNKEHEKNITYSIIFLDITQKYMFMDYKSNINFNFLSKSCHTCLDTNY